MRVPVYLVVILYLWALLGLLSGIGLLSPAVWLLMDRSGNQDGLTRMFQLIFLLLLVPPGLLLALWGGMMFWQAHRIRQNKPAALRWATGLMIAAEVLAWILTSLLVFISIGAPISAWLIPTCFAVIAAASTRTRIHLQRTAKQIE